MENQSDILNKILTKVVNIEETMKEHMVTKEEFQEFGSKIYSHVDAFAKLHETLDQELVALRGKYDRLEERMVKLEQKVGVY